MGRVGNKRAASGASTNNDGTTTHSLRTTHNAQFDDATLACLTQRIREWGRELGFSAVGISDTDLSHAEARFNQWIQAGYHGEMEYMVKHGVKRTRPAELVPGTQRVISARMPYLPAAALHGQPQDWRAIEHAKLADPEVAVVSIYARGRDYHKVMRQRLQQLAERIEAQIGPFGYRVFADSAPVLEVELAQKAGIGWRGKHTLLLQRNAGSLFFLGDIYVDIPLPTDAQTDPSSAPRQDGAYCGHCTRCINACPTGAIVAPYRVDARRCISYLTIELHGSIPVELRPLIGNRIYGCDDCQLVCPWNKFAQMATCDDFDVRNGLDNARLVDLFAWSADEFKMRLAGSAIRRIGHERWLRNIAVALGNALRSLLGSTLRHELTTALRQRTDDPSALVREHVAWALEAA